MDPNDHTLFGIDLARQACRAAAATGPCLSVPCAVAWTTDGEALVGEEQLVNAQPNNVARHLHDVLGRTCPLNAEPPLVDCHGKAFFRIQLDADRMHDYSPEEAVAALLTHLTPNGSALVLALPHDTHADDAQQHALRRAALIANRRVVALIRNTTALAICAAKQQESEEEGNVVALVASSDDVVDVARFSIKDKVLTPLAQTRMSTQDVLTTTLVQEGDRVWISGALTVPTTWSVSRFPPEDVARGAALHGCVLTNDEHAAKDVCVVAPPPSVEHAPTLAWSLGVETAGDVMSVLLPRGTVLPARKMIDIARLEPSSVGLSIVVLQGERARASDNRKIALFAVEDIDPTSPPQHMTLCFAVSSDLTLEVTVHLAFSPQEGRDDWTDRWRVPLGASRGVEATTEDALLRRQWEAQSLYQHVLWHVRATHKLASPACVDRLAEEQAWLHALHERTNDASASAEACERRAAAWLLEQVEVFFSDGDKKTIPTCSSSAQDGVQHF